MRNKLTSNKIVAIVVMFVILSTIIGIVAFKSNANTHNMVEEERQYEIESLISSISENTPVEVQDKNVSSQDLLSTEDDGVKYVLAYRPKDGVTSFPSYVNPDEIKVDEYGSFLLFYSDESMYLSDQEFLSKDENTAFADSVESDDLFIDSEEIMAAGDINVDGLSYISELMNTAEFAQVASSSSRKLSVVVCDTGMYSKNSDVAKYVNFTESYDYYNNDSNVCDGIDSHATYVTSTIIDTVGSSVASKLNIINAKIMQNGGGSTYDAYNAIMAMANKGVDIINCSWGARNNCSMLQYAIDYANKKGVCVICSSGNNSSYVSYPAAYSDSICVSAIDSNKNIASFSNTGSQVTFTAPGVRILVDGPENRQYYVSGTSFSSPALTGFAVLTMLSDVNIDSMNELVSAISGYCVDLGDPGKDSLYGNGLPVYVKKAEEPTTKSPEGTTKSPESTTKNPSSTKSPEGTTKSPESTTKAPSSNNRSYTVSFNANGGSVNITKKTVVNNSTYGTLPTPSRDYYTFAGWYTSEVGGSKITSSTKVFLTGNITLYAHWTENETSSWVKESELPKGAKVVSQKYKYKLTSYTTSTSSSLSGWTKYNSETNISYGNWSSWSKTRVNSSDKIQVETKEVSDNNAKSVNVYYFYKLPGILDFYPYNKGGNCEYREFTDHNNIMYYYGVEEGQPSYRLNNNNYGYGACYDWELWWYKETITTPATTHTEYRYRNIDKVTTYYYKKTESKESSSYPSGNNISDVTRYVRYISK